MAKGCNLIKKRFQRKCFPVNIAKFLRTPILFEERLRTNDSTLYFHASRYSNAITGKQ